MKLEFISQGSLLRQSIKVRLGGLEQNGEVGEGDVEGQKMAS